MKITREFLSTSNLKIRNYYYIFLITFLLGSLSLQAQEEVPREYNPEEFISLNRDLTLDAAFEIINQFSTKYENKIIIDPKERKGNIGVVVDNMHWKRALEYVLRSNLLQYKEHPRHYEIIEMVKQNESATPEGNVSLETREIEIKAIFFEADQQTLAEVGVDWGTLKDGKVRIQVDSKGGAAMTEDFISISGNYAGKALNVFALIRALESCSKGQVIATPQIRIMEGEEGKIKVGKNFYLTTRDFAGNTRYSEYESGTILTVIPEIITENELTFIHLQILAEKSDVVPTTFGVTKKITEGKTKVLLLNGEETALAGLFSNEISSIRKGIPFLKNLPWWFFGLRYLFGYSSQQITKKELIILIKAEIVPTIIDRLKHRILKKNYLQERKNKFEKRFKEMREESKH
ncbi:MAG: type II and III secretion system protein [bacterium]|nr:MAG: type II and III secretion system protein [bacterium]